MKNFLLVCASFLCFNLFGQSVMQVDVSSQSQAWYGEVLPVEMIPNQMETTTFSESEGLLPPSPWYNSFLLGGAGLEKGKKGKRSKKIQIGLYEIKKDGKHGYQRSLPKAVNKVYGGGSLAWSEIHGELIFAQKEGFENGTGTSFLVAKTGDLFYQSADISDFPFNHEAVRNSDPCMSRDGKVLWFASDRPGGKGGWDIWFCRRGKKGWEEPQPLEAVNTEEDERFPVLGPDSCLYFASNGRFTGRENKDLDLYRLAYPDKVGKLSGAPQIVSLPYPFNTSFDDYGICFLSGTKPLGGEEPFIGYISSNRPLKSGDPQERLWYLKGKQAFRGKVIHKQTQNPLRGAEIKVLPKLGPGFSVMSADEGKFQFYPQKGEPYSLEVIFPEFEVVKDDLLNPDTKERVYQVLPKEYLSVKVVLKDRESGAFMPETDITFLENNKRRFSQKTDSLGRLHLNLIPGNAYRLEIDLPGYQYQSRDFTGPKGKRTDLNYTFRLRRKKGTIVRGLLLDERGRRLRNTEIKAYSDGVAVQLRHALKSDRRGMFQGILPKDKSYTLVAVQDRERVAWTRITTNRYADPGMNDTIDLDLRIVRLKKGKDLLAFNYEADPILLQAAKYPEMKTLKAILACQKQLKVELGAHTDTRVEAEESQKLSQEAAEFAVDYFHIHGVKKERVLAKGYGSASPLNRCKPGVDCTEVEHLENRRVVVKVLSTR